MLSGKMIRQEVNDGYITIDPFNPNNIGPNSYDVTLASEYHVVKFNGWMIGESYTISLHKPSMTDKCELKHGHLSINPGRAYLCSTMETIGSKKYIPVLHGRSSVARHGLMVHYAGLGDIGWFGKYVLEVVNLTGYPIYVKPGTRIAQISFEEIKGDFDLYDGYYQNQDKIIAGKAI